MGMRFAMMKEHRPTTGEVVAFDGSILFLPIKMKDVSDPLTFFKNESCVYRESPSWVEFPAANVKSKTYSLCLGKGKEN